MKEPNQTAGLPAGIVPIQGAQRHPLPQGSTPRVWYERDVHPLQSFMTRTVAALRAVGFELEEKGFIHSVRADGSQEGLRETTWLWRHAGQKVWFKPAFAAEELTMEKVAERFVDRQWCLDNPHHPISHMRWMYETLAQTLEEVKAIGTSKKFVRENGGDVCFALVPEGATEEEEAEILEELNALAKDA